MTTDVIANESEDYKLGYEAGFEAGKESLRKEVEESNRNISVLYDLESYSMLSDKEVRRLIDYIKKLALGSEESIAAKATAQRMAESHEAAIQAIAQDTAAMVESVLSNTPGYKGVTPTAVTSFLTNNNEV